MLVLKGLWFEARGARVFIILIVVWIFLVSMIVVIIFLLGFVWVSISMAHVYHRQTLVFPFLKTL